MINSSLDYQHAQNPIGKAARLAVDIDVAVKSNMSDLIALENIPAYREHQ